MLPLVTRGQNYGAMDSAWLCALDGLGHGGTLCKLRFWGKVQKGGIPAILQGILANLFFDAVAATVLSSIDKNQTTNNYSSSTQQHCRIESCLAGSCRASRCELPRMLVLSGLESLLYACQFDLLSTLDRLRDKIRARSWLCGYLYDLYAELWQMHPMEMISFTLDFPAHKSQQDPTSTTYDLGTLELIILCR